MNASPVPTFARLPRHWRSLMAQGQPFVVRDSSRSPLTLAALSRGPSVDVYPRDQRTGQQGRVALAELIEALEQRDATWFVAQVALPRALVRHVPRLPIDPPGLRHPNLWVGSRGTHTPLHHDYMHNVVLQLDGRKRFTIIAPGNEEATYRKQVLGGSNYSQVRVPTAYDRRRFPRFGRLERLVVELSANDTFFLPAYWWHEVLTLSPSLMLNSWWPPRLDELGQVPLDRCVFNEAEARGTLLRYTNLERCGSDLELAAALQRARQHSWASLVLNDVADQFVRALAARHTRAPLLAAGTAELLLSTRGLLSSVERETLAQVRARAREAAALVGVRARPGRDLVRPLRTVWESRRLSAPRYFIDNNRVWLREARLDTSLA